MNLSIKDYIKDNILITDGAFGTYYYSLWHSSENAVNEDACYSCELANIYNPDIVLRIHNDYIEAGSKLIRTNTFSANTFVLEDYDTVEKVIKNGVELAKEAAKNKDVYIAASIGPIRHPGSNKDEFRFIIDQFLDLGIDIFIFETFASFRTLKNLSEYIKSKNPNTFILTQFVITDIGITKKGISIRNIVKSLADFKFIDAMGFNCGIGPTHMYNLLKSAELSSKVLSALPNAGYPEMINGKIEYVMNPKYFAEVMNETISLGIKIVGGCCGTTPEHIKLLKSTIKTDTNIQINEKRIKESTSLKPKKRVKENSFHQKVKENKFLVAVELDPPAKTNPQSLIKGSAYLKNLGVDIITIADSPMGKARADSVIMAVKILRETGIDVMPHLCCRDRNLIALRSTILAAYIEEIRNILIVTGDPVQEELKPITKGVFNLNSFGFIDMLKEMNCSEFSGDEFKISAAVNFNVANKDSELKRLEKKYENGAEIFLTQPIFEDDTIEYIKSIDKNRPYKILAGIMPLVSYANARFINNELPGITISEKYMSKFSPDMEREEAEAVGIDIAVEIAEKIKPYVDGLYLNAPFNRYEMIGKILNRI